MGSVAERIAHRRRSVLVLLCGLALVAGLTARPAQAVPIHPFLPDSTLDGTTTPSGELDKACGVAVDDEGDVYVANSANGSIDVFAASGAYLTSIADADGPCGLAVDSKGNVFAVDTGGANVVMFAPTAGAYPPTAGLTYSAAVTIDSSADARAVAVNPANDHVFVNRGTEIVEYDAEGSSLLQSEIGKGTLSDGFGVDVYDATGNVYAADETGTVYVFDPTGTKVLAAIDGSESPGGAFGALPEANVAVNQANGHVLVGDLGEGAVHEFESTGPYLATIEHEGLQDAGPSDVAVDPSAGTSTGRVYVTSGAGPGAEALAFGPLPTPTHPALPGLDPPAAETKAKGFQSPCGLAVDNQGNVYVTSTGTSAIDIFKPEGKALKYVTSISDTKRPCGVAVDSEGNVYVSHPIAVLAADRTVVRHEPNAFPFLGTPTYGAPTVVDSGGEFAGYGIAVDRDDDHLLVAHRNSIFEYDSAKNGSGILREDIGAGVLSDTSGIGVCEKSGNVYAVNGPAVYVIDPIANKVVTTINGTNAVSKKPDGSFGGSLGSSQLAVDQADCHVYVNVQEGDVYEFEASGAYVSRFNRTGDSRPLNGIAVDNSAGPDDRHVFAASGVGGLASVRAYKGPAQYGGPPEAVATGVSGADGENATLEGTVVPRGVVLSECRFEYVDQAGFEATAFATATQVPCVPGGPEIGEGEDPVPVKAVAFGLDPTVRYHFRLVAISGFGADNSSPRLFGPPAIVPQAPGEVLYTEAVLRGSVDPSGIETTYFFEYGTTGAYGSSTPMTSVEGEAPLGIEGNLFGLQQGATYHFRLVAFNSIESVVGPDQTFTTLSKAPLPQCPNAALRGGLSARLPDCRAYELVSPDANGIRPVSLLGTEGVGVGTFDTWLAAPDGESLIFDTAGSLPGTLGNGSADRYRAVREAGGWTSHIVSPSGAQTVRPNLGGVSPDHRYAFWRSGGEGGSLDAGGADAGYLRNPDGGFEPIGKGSLGVDPAAEGRWITAGAGHVIFTTAAGSAVRLEPTAPPSGTATVYDREAGGSTHVVSLLPGDVTPSADARYLAASADGSTVVFEVEGVIYERHDRAVTRQVAPAGATFAGISDDGSWVFYVLDGDAFRFSTSNGDSAQIGSGGESTVINVSADGTHVYFVSPLQLDGAEGEAGADNLYVWDGASIGFVATLSPDDMGPGATTLSKWTAAVGPDVDAFLGRGADPSRTTPDGAVFVFQSHADLTAYESEGHTEIYRYDSEAEDLICISCPPDGSPPVGEAELQRINIGLEPEIPGETREVSPVTAVSRIPNVTDDGRAVFFQSSDPLVSEDDDGMVDVYEWKDGEISLISSGQSGKADYLYAMSSDGRDVFFETNDSLVPADRDGGAASIYDARAFGGFAAGQGAPPCLEDDCQGPPGPPPSLSAPLSSALTDAGPAKRRCSKARRTVRRKGKVRCVPRHRKQRHSQRGAGGGRGDSR